MNIKQGVDELVEVVLPFEVAYLDRFSLDFYQNGVEVVTKSERDCNVYGTHVSVTLLANDTGKFSPQRISLNFRGVYPDGSTVIIEEIPCTVSRSVYGRDAT